MSSRIPSTARADCIYIIVSLIALGCLLLPAIAQSNSMADEAFCLKQMKEIMLMLHNHHDTYKAFPLASSQPIINRPGSNEGDTAAGYSWLTRLLPFQHERGEFFDALNLSSNRRQKPPFSPDLKARDGARETHPAAVALGEFVCPSFAGNKYVSAGGDYKPLPDGSLPAVATYHAFAGSHFENADGEGRMLTPELIDQGAPYEGNGVMPFPWRVGGQLRDRGLSIASVSDGTSHTFAVAESIEPSYSAWIDGQAMWLVAAWPGNKLVPTVRPSENVQEAPTLRWPDEQKAAMRASINLIADDGSPMTYLEADRWSGTNERKWGPSSNHRGLVGHAFTDGRASMVSTDVDAQVYLHLVTRNGREMIPDDVRQRLFKNETAYHVAQPNPTTWPMPRRGRAVEFDPNQWTSTEWSPLAIGDLRLSFPQILDLADFRLNPSDRNMLQYTGPSKVFSTLTYDRRKSEFQLQVSEQYARSATPQLVEQLNKGLETQGTDDVSSRTKRMVWRKDAAWENGAATFEFALYEPLEGKPPRITIRVLDVRDTRPSRP